MNKLQPIIRRIERFIGSLLLTGILFALLFQVGTQAEMLIPAGHDEQPAETTASFSVEESVSFPSEILESALGTEVDIDINPSWYSSARDFTTSVAWADMDGDGDLDLAVGNGIIYDEECFCEIGGQNKVYLNEGNELEEEAAWIATERDDTTSVAWADVDGNGYLDLAVGNRQIEMLDHACGYTGSPNKVYLNFDGMLETEPSWESSESDFTTSVAWGDVDGDGDFDLAVGNGTVSDSPIPCDAPRNNKIYLNTGTELETTASWVSSEDDNTGSLAWGDIDDDDDLDLVVGNAGPNRLYQNDGGELSLVWTSQVSDTTSSVVWVDVDLDDDLDLSVSNVGALGQLYLNQEGTLTPPQPLPPESQDSLTLAWGDTDSDGDLDLVTAGKQHMTVYHNMNGDLLPIWNSVDEPDWNTYVAWADVDGDGDLDLAVAGGRRMRGELNRIHLNRTLLLGDPWSSQREDDTSSLAWGDVNGDGRLDLAVANRSINGGPESRNQLYLNSPEGFSTTNSWQPNDHEESYSVAWGDVDGDGDLDLAVGNAPLDDGQGGQNQLYLNEGGMLQNTPSWLSDDADFTASIAWGDYDLDGDLDLVVGNQSIYDADCECLTGSSENKIYENDGQMLDSEAVWVSEETDKTNSVVWGDVDSDGDLDLAVGNDGNNRLYLNEDQTLTLSWSSSTDDNTANLAWGDVDADGDLDLMAGNYLAPNRLYLNEEGELTAAWSDGESFSTIDVAWADVEGDGDLDLALANAIEGIKVYLNQDGVLASEFEDSLSLAGTTDSYAVAWADYDFDGDMDLAIGRDGQNQVYVNRRTTPQRHGGQPPGVAIKPFLAPADFYATPRIHHDMIPIPFTLFEQEEIEEVDGFYSLDGGGLWLPAVGSITPATEGPATNNYFYDWDVSASDFFGQSDNVVFRLEAIIEEGTTTNSVPGPFEISNISTQSYPFRVRGNQIRVMSGTVPVEDAFVYQLEAGQSNNAEFIGAPFVTNFDGYLQGRGELFVGDRLVALLPVKTSETGTLPEGGTLYYTSAAPTETGLDFYTIQEGGLHTLTVSAANPLLLFDLSISLEWDARNDEGFIEDIADAINEASAVLYDVSNGQIGLGDVTVYQAKENWSDAHIVVYASNDIRPSANLGGIVLTSTHDIGLTGVISDAYLPGQIRMGPNWDPFGENTADLSQEWWRALAHELAHYLLFMPDNYIGISDQGYLTALDCQGSFMTNTHDDSYSEFLTSSEWSGDCLQTIAARTTGRADWQTITTFYPELNGSGGNPGPTVLPLNVTFVDLLEPTSVITESIETQNYDLRDAESGALLPLPRAEGYLFKTQGTTDLTDDIIVPLGSTGANGDRIKVRGASEGDDLCVFGSSGVWVGCTEMTEFNTSLFMAETTEWPPTIEVTPITSRTLIISATLPASVDALNVQLFPTYADAPTGTVTTAPWDVMTPVDADNPLTFRQVITMDYGAFSGFVRVWVPDSSPEKESISQFVLNSSVWGGESRGWQGESRGWQSNTRGWGAPLTSAEGQVTIFNVAEPYAETGISALQTLNTLSNLPSWLTLVGNAYRVSLEKDVTQNITRTISFDYLQRDVPSGLEYTLAIYHTTDNGANWQQLETDLDLDHNRATTLMPNDAAGIYALISTIEMPALQAGWNQFGYPIAGTRSVETALASISGDYASLYFYQPSTDEWQLYDETVINEHPTYTSLVNDLTELEFGQSYWIYATEPITLYLGVPESSLTLREGEGANRRGGENGPPIATFYGPLLSTDTFTPTVGMTINATVNGNLCGQSSVQELAGELVYKIQVAADTGNGCGTSGQTVRFMIGEQRLGSDSWDNSQAKYYPLLGDSYNVYLPIIR